MLHQAAVKSSRLRVSRFLGFAGSALALCLALGTAEVQAQSSRRSADRSSRRAGPRDSARAPASEILQVADNVPETTAAGRHPLNEVIEFANQSRDALERIDDYEAIFNKTELVDDRKVVKQSMLIKLRSKPFSVYLKFRSGSENGREVIYVNGKNNNNLLVREVGIKAIAGTLSLRPNSREVMAENRYPITQIGMGKMLETAYTIWDAEKKADPTKVDVKFFPNAKLGEIECEAFQITHQQASRELKFHQSRLYFDKESKLPIRAERYGWPRRQGDKPPLVEEYTYSNIKTNIGLTDGDFDPRNPKYGF